MRCISCSCNLPCVDLSGVTETLSTAGNGWRAHLDLEFTLRAPQTVLTRNRHQGPLVVQKALYPEGKTTCHLVVLHPPGGIAAGDVLSVRALLHEGAQALLTTPGAAKWYRSEGSWARQDMRLNLEEHAVLEWLPRENILFEGANASTTVDIELSPTAVYFGWDILTFGRLASGEAWRRGKFHMHTKIRRAGRPLWAEIANLDAQSGFTESAVGLADFRVCATFLVAEHDIDASLLGKCRELPAPRIESRTGITSVPGLLIARYLGNSTEDPFQWFVSLWKLLRRTLLGKPAHPPRVWAC